MNLSARVLRRFADQIADPKEKLATFQAAVAKFGGAEEQIKKELPRLREAAEEQDRAYKEWKQSGMKGRFERDVPDDLKATSSVRRDVYSVVRSGGWFEALHGTGQRLFLAILQQYALPPKLQKAIESAAKFWSKTRIVSPKPDWTKAQVEIDIIFGEAYLKIIAELSKQAANAEAAIVKGQLHSDPKSNTKTHVGGFDVVNTGGFDEETMKKAADVVAAVEKVMTAHGLGKVCYGDILISKTIDRKKSVMAFYLTSSDEMFVRADLPEGANTLRYVCHELAHRLEHKFLKDKQADITALYRVIRDTRAGKLEMPNEGDTVVYNGTKMAVIDYDFKHEAVVIRAAPEPSSPVQPAYVMPVKVFYQLQGKEIDTGLDFITPYARTDAGENFAEMVSFYVLGKLPKNQVDLLEPVLFQ